MANRDLRRRVDQLEDRYFRAVSDRQPGEAIVTLDDGYIAEISSLPQSDREYIQTQLLARLHQRNIRQYQSESANITQSALEQQYNIQGRGGLAAPNKYSNRYNYHTYKYDYYCGSQAKVFFGDIWVDDIVNIQYNISQSKEPIYGYASQYYDAMAMGTVLGEGMLAISFKETGYLNVIRAYMEEQAAGVNSARFNVRDRLNNGQEGAGYTTRDYAAQVSPNYNPSFIRRGETIEEVLDHLKSVNVQPEQEYDNDNPTKNNVSFISSQNEDRIKDFEDAAEVLEDVIWGDTNGRPFMDSTGSFSVDLNEEVHGLKRADQFDYKYDSSRNAIGIEVPRNGYTDAFNIVLTFGDMSDHRAEHTVQVLNDVHFTGQSMIISPTGEPIAEVYRFLFRDLNKTVNTRRYNVNPVAFNIGREDPFRVSSRQSIEQAIGDNRATDIIITVLSSFNNDQWTSLSNVSINPTDLLMPPFRVDSNRGLHGSLFRYIEDALFRYVTETSNPNQTVRSAERLALKITTTQNTEISDFFSNPTDIQAASGGVSSVNGSSTAPVDSNEINLNVIVENQDSALFQGGVAIYKVIAPGTNDYAALDLVRREDFFNDHPQGAGSLEAEANPYPRDNRTGVVSSNTGQSGAASDNGAAEANALSAGAEAALNSAQTITDLSAPIGSNSEQERLESELNAALIQARQAIAFLPADQQADYNAIISDIVEESLEPFLLAQAVESARFLAQGAVQDVQYGVQQNTIYGNYTITEDATQRALEDREAAEIITGFGPLSDIYTDLTSAEAALDIAREGVVADHTAYTQTTDITAPISNFTGTGLEVQNFIDFTTPLENIQRQSYVPYNDEGEPAIGYGTRISSLTNESLVQAGIAADELQAAAILAEWRAYGDETAITQTQAQQLAGYYLNQRAVPEANSAFAAAGVDLGSLPVSIQQTAVDTAFQTGNIGQFQGFINAAGQGDYTTAAFELLYRNPESPESGVTANFSQTPNRVFARVEAILSDENANINAELARSLLSQIDASVLNSTYRRRYNELLQQLGN